MRTLTIFQPKLHPHKQQKSQTKMNYTKTKGTNVKEESPKVEVKDFLGTCNSRKSFHKGYTTNWFF